MKKDGRTSQLSSKLFAENTNKRATNSTPIALSLYPSSNAHHATHVSAECRRQRPMPVALAQFAKDTNWILHKVQELANAAFYAILFEGRGAQAEVPVHSNAHANLRTHPLLAPMPLHAAFAAEGCELSELVQMDALALDPAHLNVPRLHHPVRNSSKRLRIDALYLSEGGQMWWKSPSSCCHKRKGTMCANPARHTLRPLGPAPQVDDVRV